MLHCPSNAEFKIIGDSIYCLPDRDPGLLLGLVKVTFCALPRITDEYINEILIDVGLSKCLSIPIKLKVVDPKLFKVNKYLESEKLLLNNESIFNNAEVQIKETDSSAINLEDKQLVKIFHEELKQAQLYSNDCALLLESTNQDLYYKKLHMLLFLEGDYGRQLTVKKVCSFISVVASKYISYFI